MVFSHERRHDEEFHIFFCHFLIHNLNSSIRMWEINIARTYFIYVTNTIKRRRRREKKSWKNKKRSEYLLAIHIRVSQTRMMIFYENRSENALRVSYIFDWFAFFLNIRFECIFINDPCLMCDGRVFFCIFVTGNLVTIQKYLFFLL